MDTRPRVIVTFVVLASIIVPALSGTPSPAMDRSGGGEVTLFSYFEGNGETGVYLQASEDGFSFEAVNDGQPIFTPPTSWPEDQQLTRDPSVVYHDGTFHMVWTTNWEGRVFGYARSPDLQTWVEPTLVAPFPEELPDAKQPKNVWAPELHYDPVDEAFFVVFSSTIPERLGEEARGMDPSGNNHRMYVTRTENFDSFSDAEVFFDPGFSSIDGQLVHDEYGSPQPADDRWVMVFKHERGPENGGKNLRLVFRNPLTGAFSGVSEPIVGPGSGVNEHWAEGPTLLKGRAGGWNLYWDAYSTGYYGLAHSPDLNEWIDVTEKLDLDVDHPRHGTFFRAPASAVAWFTGEREDDAG